MEILIVGAGEMGRWFADVVADADRTLGFLDIDAEAATAAADSLDGRVVESASTDEFDLVCVAVPLSVAESAIEEHAERCIGAMVDVSGAMTGPISAMRDHVDGRERVSLHPLFAAENAPGNVAVVVDRSGPVTGDLLDRLSAKGNRLVETTPDEHDRAMETVQAKVHAAILAYGLVADDVPTGLTTPVSRRLDALVDTVTGGTPRVYAEIQERFEGADEVAAAAGRIAAADPETFERLYREAGHR